MPAFRSPRPRAQLQYDARVLPDGRGEICTAALAEVWML